MYYWVYLPDHDEAGCVVEAESFDAAFHEGCQMLCPDDGIEVQIHELGESQSYIAGDGPEPEPDLEAERVREFFVSIADLSAAEQATQVQNKMDDGTFTVVALARAARVFRSDPKLNGIFENVKSALLGGM